MNRQPTSSPNWGIAPPPLPRPVTQWPSLSGCYQPGAVQDLFSQLSKCIWCKLQLDHIAYIYIDTRPKYSRLARQINRHAIASNPWHLQIRPATLAPWTVLPKPPRPSAIVPMNQDPSETAPKFLRQVLLWWENANHQEQERGYHQKILYQLSGQLLVLTWLCITYFPVVLILFIELACPSEGISCNPSSSVTGGSAFQFLIGTEIVYTQQECGG